MFLPRYYQEYLQECLNAINEDGVKMLGHSYSVLVKLSFFDFLNFHMKVYGFTVIHYMHQVHRSFNSHNMHVIKFFLQPGTKHTRGMQCSWDGWQHGL